MTTVSLLQGPRQGQERHHDERGKSSAKLNEILKKRSRDDSDFQLRIAVHPTVLERLRTEDEKLIIEMEKRYFGKLSFRPEPNFHAEQFKIVNAATNEELRQRRLVDAAAEKVDSQAKKL